MHTAQAVWRLLPVAGRGLVVRRVRGHRQQTGLVPCDAQRRIVRAQSRAQCIAQRCRMQLQAAEDAGHNDDYRTFHADGSIAKGKIG